MKNRFTIYRLLFRLLFRLLRFFLILRRLNRFLYGLFRFLCRFLRGILRRRRIFRLTEQEIKCAGIVDFCNSVEVFAVGIPSQIDFPRNIFDAVTVAMRRDLPVPILFIVRGMEILGSHGKESAVLREPERTVFVYSDVPNEVLARVVQRVDINACVEAFVRAAGVQCFVVLRVTDHDAIAVCR